MKIHTLKRITLLLLGLLLAPAFVHGQGFGSMVGTVTDNSGSVIVSAKVTAIEVGTGLARTVTTDANGYYVIPTLRPTQYNLSVSASGFRSFSQKDITLLADQTLTVNVEMKVGATSETVEVTAATVQVNVADGTASQVIDRSRISNLPLNGRNAAQLTLLVAGAVNIPGVVNPTGASGGGAIQGQTKTYPGAITVSTNGSRQNWLSYQLDGGNNIDEYTNVNQPFPFPDALQEFSVQSSNYSAQYGQSAGGVVNIVTRTGGNQFHGDLFEFVRNPVFNAQNFFAVAPVVDVFKRNQFGATAGGPIIHDKTFFFLGYQGTRIRNVQTFTATVPTAAQLNGDFSAVTKQLKYPDKTNIPGNKIDLTAHPYDSASLALVNFLPIAQADPTSGAVTVARPLNQDFDEYVARFDHSFTPKDQFTFRHYYAQFNAPAVFNKTDVLSYIDQASILSQNFLVNETHIFNTNVLNEFHFSYSREAASRGPSPNAINVDDLGSNLTFQPTAKAIQSINVSGFFSFGDNPRGKFVRNNYAFNDNVSWIMGKHTFHFGGVLELSRVDVRNLFNQPGLFTFDNNGSNSGSAMADFLFGWMRQFQQGAGEFKENYNSFPGLYIQDDWHVTRRLTLNLGLRWEALLPWKEKQNRVELFNPADVAAAANVKSTVFPLAPAGLFFVGDPGVSAHTGTTGSYNNFAPRVGFAYDVMGDGKTSIRGGAGIFYGTRQEGIINNRFVDVTPFSPQTILSTAGGNVKPGSFSDPYCINTPTQTTFGCTAQGVQFPAVFPPPSTTPFLINGAPLSLVVSWDPNRKIMAPTVYNWNLALEHEMAWGILARVAYVGSHTSHIRESAQLNPTIPVTSGTPPATFSQYAANQVWMADFDVNSSYHSLQLTAEKRASRNITLLANYTYSKSIDDLPVGAGVADIGSDSPSSVPFGNPLRHAFDRGPSDFDHTHRFVVSYVWQLADLKNQNMFVRTFLGGWQLNGVLGAQTGRPFTVLAGRNLGLTGLPTQHALQAGPAFGPGACVTDKFQGPLATKPSPCTDLLNTVSFANSVPAGQFSFGNVAKGQFRWPGQFTWDMGLVKTFQVTERVGIQFRAEYFNILNHPNWASDDTSVNSTATVTSANFGAIRTAEDPRIGQLAVKIIF
jgi:hypothetical protein